MVFTSHIFIFYYLPLCLLIYYGLPKGWRNLFLTLASYVFYGWWKPWFVTLMLTSTVVDYTAGRQITAPGASPRRRKLALLASLTANLGLLGVFKYAMFAQSNVNALIQLLGAQGFAIYEITLPIGISFYTFQTMSYSIDLYQGTAQPVKRFNDFSCFVALFPQLIAGPIVRYNTIAEQLASREHTLARFSSGVSLFIIGFSKKILLANPMGAVADTLFATQGPDPLAAWFGIVAYAFQIYFDFSGYSDMAIGLGRMLGFRFRENFRWPYASRSITEFWRRWHISLSSWFRDYLYIPLGGNRKGPGRTYANLVIVFLLCGLWHGDAWAFVAWGAFHGLFLVLERRGLRERVEGCGSLVSWVYTVLVVMLGWNLFRSEELIPAAQRYVALVGGGDAVDAAYRLGRLMQPSFVLALLAGCVLSFPWLPWIAARRERDLAAESNAGLWRAADVLGTAGVVVLWVAALAFSAASTYSPFIYFRF